MTDATPLFDAIVAATGTQSKLAVKLGVSRSVVSQWKRRGRIPPGWVIPVERATQGQVTRYQIRPDLYPVERVA